MKKIFAIWLCAFIMLAMPLAVFAEGEESVTVDEITTEADATTTEEEIVTEGETAGTEAVPDTAPPEKSEAQVEAEATTKKIVQYVQEHLEEISVIITMILTVFYQVRKHSALNKSVGTLNNNSIAVAENSAAAISNALTAVQAVSDTVKGYKDEMANMLAEVRANEEEKQALKKAIDESNNYVKTAKLANTELANEIAELLVLANIPNSKKEELYARHRAAVDAIDAAETEVKGNVGQEE